MGQEFVQLCRNSSTCGNWQDTWSGLGELTANSHLSHVVQLQLSLVKLLRVCSSHSDILTRAPVDMIAIASIPISRRATYELMRKREIRTRMLWLSESCFWRKKCLVQSCIYSLGINCCREGGGTWNFPPELTVASKSYIWLSFVPRPLLAIDTCRITCSWKDQKVWGWIANCYINYMYEHLC